jgi:hypothetical protein
MLLTHIHTRLLQPGLKRLLGSTPARSIRVTVIAPVPSS